MPSNVFPRPLADGSIRYGARRRVKGKVKPLGTFDTPEEAWEAVAIDKRGGHVEPSAITWQEVGEKWTRQHVSRLSPATQQNYARALTKFTDQFGSDRAATTGRDELSDWSIDNTEDNVRSMFSMIEWARDREVLALTQNPLAGIKGRPPAKRHKYRVLTGDELTTLADAALTLPALVGPVMRTMIIVAARSGMRPGELFALRWRDVDFTSATINVRASVDVTGKEKPPKNGLERTIALTQAAADALDDLIPGEPDALVFTLMHGAQFKKTSMAYWFDKIRDRAGFTGYRFYDLRHTAATYLYVDLQLPSYVVAAQLGHQDNGALIERRYGHPEHARSLDAIREADSRVTSGAHNVPGRVPAGSLEDVQSA